MLLVKITDYFRGIRPVVRRGGAMSVGKRAHAKCMEKVLTAWHAREGEIAGNGRRRSPISWSSLCLTPRSLWLFFFFWKVTENLWTQIMQVLVFLEPIINAHQIHYSKWQAMLVTIQDESLKGFLTVATKVNVSLMDLSCALHSAWLFYHLKSFSPYNEK